jgi:hypothetical protein
MGDVPVCYPGTTYPGHTYFLNNWVNTDTGHLAGLSQGFRIVPHVPDGVYTSTLIPGIRMTFGVGVRTPGCHPAVQATTAALTTPAGSIPPAMVIIPAAILLLFLVWLGHRLHDRLWPDKPLGKHARRGRIYALSAKDPLLPAS